MGLKDLIARQGGNGAVHDPAEVLHASNADRMRYAGIFVASLTMVAPEDLETFWKQEKRNRERLSIREGDDNWRKMDDAVRVRLQELHPAPEMRM
ncbi:conserved hypothetical protein [Hyphomicrobiales bacterium]|nr:conserved hypothetical protein [Hyphomicrobiales bacterium]CAH1702788.1 hypothetical protein BOSEA1005_30660 [Hyphomicrobiales bacterium]CAI0346978.1 conserved hypothetical protein [Hyphomicrobiales bacterium]